MVRGDRLKPFHMDVLEGVRSSVGALGVKVWGFDFDFDSGLDHSVDFTWLHMSCLVASDDVLEWRGALFVSTVGLQIGGVNFR